MAESQAKDENDGWSATMSTRGDGFEIEIKAEGNEAEGETPLVVADMTVGRYLAEETDLGAGDRVDNHEDEKSRGWSTGNVRYTVTMYGESEKVEKHAEDIFETARSALPEDCTKVVA